MIRIFLDSTVLFSAAYSATGHSRDLLLLATREEIVIVLSKLVVEETYRNISSFSPEALPFLLQVIASIPFEYVQPTKREVMLASKRVVLKDAPIVAAAKKAKVDLLVTMDKKHLLDKPEVAEYLKKPVVTPKEAMNRIHKSGKEIRH